ncbi:MAG: hypothetical protein JW809_04650 [Pirellulales bacterium]|nr:hypothetical protein [Pirellulales bacterium]
MIRHVDRFTELASLIPGLVKLPPAAAPRRPYWCDRQLAIALDGPQGRVERILDKPFARFGGHADSEFVLRDPRVAGGSLYVHATEAGVYYVGLPRAGLARRLSGWFRADAPVAFGPYAVSARLLGPVGGRDDVPPDLNAKGTIRSPHPLIAVSLGGEEVATCRLNRRLTILGSHPSSNVQFKSERVSDCQLVLYWARGSLWAIDLLGPHRTTRQGLAIDAVRLEQGQPLSFGDVEISYSGCQRASAGSRGGEPLGVGPASKDGALPGAIALLPAQPREPRPMVPLRTDDFVEVPGAGAVVEEDLDDLFARVTGRMIEAGASAAVRRRRRRWVYTILSGALAGAGIVLAFGYAGQIARWWLNMR